MSQAATSRIDIAGQSLEYLLIDGPVGAPCIVFLHEGLGSIGLWKDFPQRLCAASACSGLVYSRLGYGHSDPLRGPRPKSFMHDEARHGLPGILVALGIEKPIIVGHSDGASIGLIFAASPDDPVRALVVLAPHVMVEDIALEAIRTIRGLYTSRGLRSSLARHHADVDGAFYGWNDVWLSDEFRNWDIRDLLTAIRCPVFAIQGYDDAYGTMLQIEEVERHVPHALSLRLMACGHAPHQDQADHVLAAVARFVSDITQSTSSGLVRSE